MQLVFEFCAVDLGPVIEAIRRVLTSLDYRMQAGTGYVHVPTTDTLEGITERLERSEINSFVAYPKNGPVRYVLLTSQKRQGDLHGYFMGTVEYTSADYHGIWNLLLGSLGLFIVCIGYETAGLQSHHR
jgi:hypothetical protein